MVLAFDMSLWHVCDATSGSSSSVVRSLAFLARANCGDGLAMKPFRVALHVEGKVGVYAMA